MSDTGEPDRAPPSVRPRAPLSVGAGCLAILLFIAGAAMLAPAACVLGSFSNLHFNALLGGVVMVGFVGILLIMAAIRIVG